MVITEQYSLGIGDTKVLPCKVVNRLGPLQWTKDGFGLGITWELNGFGRYRYPLPGGKVNRIQLASTGRGEGCEG